MSRRSLTENENESVRGAVRHLIRTKGTQAAAAKALGMKPSVLSMFLSRKAGVSEAVAERAASAVGSTLPLVLASSHGTDIALSLLEGDPETRQLAAEGMPDIQKLLVGASALADNISVELLRKADPDTVGFFADLILANTSIFREKGLLPIGARQFATPDDVNAALWTIQNVGKLAASLRKAMLLISKTGRSQQEKRAMRMALMRPLADVLLERRDEDEPVPEWIEKSALVTRDW